MKIPKKGDKFNKLFDISVIYAENILHFKMSDFGQNEIF